MINITNNIFSNSNMLKVNDEGKAYLLGLFVNSSLKDDVITFNGNCDIVEYINDTFGLCLVKESIGYKIFHQEIKNYLYHPNGNKLYPLLKARCLQLAFIRGIYDSDLGSLEWNNHEPLCKIYAPSVYLKSIADFFKIPCEIYSDYMSFYGTNCIDFLGEIYNSNASYKSQEKYNKYIEFINPLNITFPECRVLKVHELAAIPSKCKESDAGYDLTVIKPVKQLLPNVTLYDTGIQIQVAHGLYAEVVPRSSLSKSGFMLANSIGIIDRGYTGNIYIALIKVDPSAPDLVLPFKCCQLIFRQQIHVNIKEVKDSFQNTSRGIGGFGSTSSS
jgi:dUTP pyrophosphatase